MPTRFNMCKHLLLNNLCESGEILDLIRLVQVAKLWCSTQTYGGENNGKLRAGRIG
jgi:hypothetical protein